MIHTVATFARRTELHRVGCAGLVDFDSRSEDEVADLASGGVHVLPVSEVENLLLLPDVFLALAAAQRFESVDAQAKLDLLRRSVLDTIRREADNVALRATRRRIDAQVRRIGLAATGIEALDAEFASAVADMRLTELYEKYRAALASAVEAEDCVGVLKLYDNKGLLAEAARHLGMHKRSLEEFVGRALRGKDDEDLLTALTAALPTVITRP